MSTRPGTIPIVGARPNQPQAKRGPERVARGRRRNEGRADITLANINLLYINNQSTVDHEVFAPLGPLYLIASLERADYVVDFADHQLLPMVHPDRDAFDLDDAIWWLGDMAEVVGLSCMANLLPFTLMLAERIKRHHPSKTILLGGVGPFGVESLILERFASIAAVGRGEGEATIVEAMDALRAGRPLDGIPGLFARAPNGTVGMGGERPRLAPADIPPPAYHHLDMARYHSVNVITNRGCPYPCSFCSVAPIWNRRVSSRPVEEIVAEIRMLREQFGVSKILFQDEFFYTGEKKMLAFCDALDEAELDIRWKCFGRANLVTERAMRRMAESGCDEIRYGIESASDRVLERVTKKFDFGQAMTAVGTSLGIFPTVEAFFIWGFPFEDMSDFLQTAVHMDRFRRMGVNVLPSLLSMLPQTDIYKDYLAGCYDGRLSFHRDLLPIYVVTGHEVLASDGNVVPDRYAPIYDLVEAHPDIFPGFYLYDAEANVRPKQAVLKQMGFH